MRLWIARDKNKCLYLYRKKPEYSEEFGWWFPEGENTIFSDDMWNIDELLFPEVTVENSPVEVEINLIQSGKILTEKLK